MLAFVLRFGALVVVAASVLALPAASMAVQKSKPHTRRLVARTAYYRLNRAMVRSAAMRRYPGRHHVYEVRVRNPYWQSRAYSTHRAAHTYYRWLGYLGMQRRIHRSGNAWVVSARSSHTHRAGAYMSLPAARSVQAIYRSRGFAAWIHTWRI